jgi:uncharacterized paraquat-inducible protein A
MAEVSNQNGKRRELLITAGQLAAILAGIAAIFLAVTTFLTFVSNECFLPQLFVCFPAK